jgi:uncharacterized protein (DUF983 family)
MAELAHPALPSMLRGLRHRCPHCGEGQLFRKYLKVNERCPHCGHDLTRYRADDGPAYVTILLVGHLIVGPLLFFPIVWRSSPLYSLPLILIPLSVITLLLLPRVKGAWIGLMYAIGAKDSDAALHTADYAD